MKDFIFVFFVFFVFFFEFFEFKKNWNRGNYCGLFMSIEDTLICNVNGYFNNYY